MNTKEEKVRHLFHEIKETAVHFASKTKPIVSPKGKAQNWVIDLRPILLNPNSLETICDLFWERFESRLPFQVGGMEVAAIPLVTALVMTARQKGLDVNGFVIRKTRKRSGLGNRIEGRLNSHPIMLVDDIFNSGSSLEKARKALEQEKLEIREAFVVIDFKSKKGKAWQKNKQIPVRPLFERNQFNLPLYKNPGYKKDAYKILWRFIEPGAFPFHVVPKSTPLLVDNHIFMGTDVGKMICIDRHSGTKFWEFNTNTTHNKGIWSSPAYHDGLVYFGAYNGTVYCLNAINGQLVWKNPCCEFIGSSPLIVPHLNMMFLGLEHQRPRMMGSNAAFDLSSSNRVWERPQKKYQHGSAAYDFKNEAVIFGNADHDITSYSAKDGNIRWSQPTVRSTKYPPAVDPTLGIVAAASFDGNIYILDLDTGELKSKTQTGEICYTTPLIHEGRVYSGSGDRHLYVIHAHSGKLIKKINCKAKVYSSPKFIKDRIVFGTCGGEVLEVNPDDLEVTSKFTIPDAITNAISASSDGSTIYASTCMNEIYALERNK